MGFQRFLVSLYSIKRIPGIGVITITRMWFKPQSESPAIIPSVYVTQCNAARRTAAKMAPSN
jgi:hypothetical protein